MALKLSAGIRNKILGINTNLLTNGTFGSDFSGWTQVTGTAQRNSGTGADATAGFAECVNSGAVYAEFKNTTAISCKPNQLYKLTYYFRKAATDGVAAAVTVGSTDGGADNLYVLNTDTTTDTWLKKEYTFRTGSTQTEIHLRFKTHDNTDTKKSWFDDITLVHASASMKDIFYKGFIKVYTGTQPGSSNDAPTGNLLCTIYSNGTSEGLSFAEAASGTVSKSGTETWTGTAVATGTAGWFRLIAPGDTGASSQTDERIDGAVATAGAQLNMSSTSIVTGAVQTISTFSITMPAE